MIALLALLLAGAQDAEPAYRADGSEPFWTLEIDQERMTYHRNSEILSEFLPLRRATANGYRYETNVMVVDIKREECIDEAATIRADSVTVIVGEETVHGCGGEILDTEEIAEAE